MNINLHEIEDLIQELKKEHVWPVLNRFTKQQRDRVNSHPDSLQDSRDEYAQILRERIGYSLNDLSK